MPRTQQRKQKDGDKYDPNEILRDLFAVRVVLIDSRKSLPLPPPQSSWQRPRKRLAYSSSFDSETHEELSKELDLMLAEPEEAVERRIEQIRKNRNAEANRV